MTPYPNPTGPTQRAVSPSSSCGEPGSALNQPGFPLLWWRAAADGQSQLLNRRSLIIREITGKIPGSRYETQGVRAFSGTSREITGKSCTGKRNAPVAICSRGARIHLTRIGSEFRKTGQAVFSASLQEKVVRVLQRPLCRSEGGACPATHEHPRSPAHVLRIEPPFPRKR